MYKIMFMLFTMFTTMLIITSNSWLSMYIGLEMNLLAFTILIYKKNNPNSMECVMKYFLTQALASALLLFALIMNYSEIYNYCYIMFNFALMLKMGMAPLHFWLPEVMEGLTWMNCFIISTVQKIAPMIMLMNQPMMNSFNYIIIVINIMIGSLMGLNQISLRKIMAYSSITHMSWMYTAILMNQMIWMYYFIVYTMISLNIMMMFLLMNINTMNEIYMKFNNNNLIKLIFSFNFISLGGLPPFLGFYPKWLIINNLIINNFNFLALMMMIFTLITLYFYMKFMMNTFFTELTLINKYLNLNNNYFIMMINIFSLIALIYISLTLNLI